MTLVTNIETPPTGGGKPCMAMAAFTRPADTNAYSAGDVVSDDSSTAKALVFDGTGRSGLIHGINVVWEDTIAVTLALYLFRTEPTNHQDNAALALAAADLQALVHYQELASGDAKALGTDTSWYRAPLLSARPLATYATDKTGRLYGLLVDTTGHTPESGCQITITLQIEPIA